MVRKKKKSDPFDDNFMQTRAPSNSDFGKLGKLQIGTPKIG
jgi:hypothetical protein